MGTVGSSGRPRTCSMRRGFTRSGNWISHEIRSSRPHWRPARWLHSFAASVVLGKPAVAGGPPAHAGANPKRLAPAGVRRPKVKDATMTPVSNVESIAAATANNPPRVRTRALLLVNRKARLGRSLPAAALDRLTRAGFELIEECVDRRELMSQAVRAYRGRADAVVIGGGDGTLSAAADGLVEAQLPLGIIPLGTANDLARTLGLPTDPVA